MGKKDQHPVRICPTCRRSGMVYKKKARKVGSRVVTDEVIEVCRSAAAAE